MEKDLRIIRKFCWCPYTILDDYGNDIIKWFGNAYIMQQKLFNVWKDIKFVDRNEYFDYLFDNVIISSPSFSFADSDLILMLVSVEKRRKLYHCETNNYYSNSDYFNLSLSFEEEENNESVVYASLSYFGTRILSDFYKTLTKLEKEVVKYKANKIRYFYKNKELI